MANEVLTTLRALDKIEAEQHQRVADLLEVGTDLAVRNVTVTGYTLPQEFRQALIASIATIWTDAAMISRTLVEGQFAKSLKSASLIDLVLADFVDSFGRARVESISNTTVSIVVDKVRRGLARGQSKDELIRQILNESPAVAAGRARTIVANEAHTMAQYTSQRVAEASGKLLIKVWNSVNDERTRDFGLPGLTGSSSDFDHRSMNGQTRPLSDSFAVPTRLGGFELLQFPGDPNGSAGNVINCRCIQTYKEAI